MIELLYFCHQFNSNLMSNTITFNKVSYEQFKVEYNSAVENKREMFVFEGNDFLTAYAKYMIEYLKNKFE